MPRIPIPTLPLGEATDVRQGMSPAAKSAAVSEHYSETRRGTLRKVLPARDMERFLQRLAAVDDDAAVVAASRALDSVELSEAQVAGIVESGALRSIVDLVDEFDGRPNDQISVLAVLAECLRFDVAQSAFRALGGSHRLQELASSKSKKISEMALCSLANMFAKHECAVDFCEARDGDGIAVLLGLVSSTNTEIQQHAVRAVFNLALFPDTRPRLDKAKVLKPLASIVSGSNSLYARSVALKALGECAVDPAMRSKIVKSLHGVPFCMQLLVDESPAISAHAALMLANLCSDEKVRATVPFAEALPVLVRWLTEVTNPSSMCLLSVMRGLANLTVDDAVMSEHVDVLVPALSPLASLAQAPQQDREVATEALLLLSRWVRTDKPAREVTTTDLLSYCLRLVQSTESDLEQFLAIQVLANAAHLSSVAKTIAALEEPDAITALLVQLAGSQITEIAQAGARLLRQLQPDEKLASLCAGEQSNGPDVLVEIAFSDKVSTVAVSAALQQLAVVAAFSPECRRWCSEKLNLTEGALSYLGSDQATQVQLGAALVLSECVLDKVGSANFRHCGGVRLVSQRLAAVPVEPAHLELRLALGAVLANASLDDGCKTVLAECGAVTTLLEALVGKRYLPEELVLLLSFVGNALAFDNNWPSLTPDHIDAVWDLCRAEERNIVRLAAMALANAAPSSSVHAWAVSNTTLMEALFALLDTVLDSQATVSEVLRVILAAGQIRPSFLGDTDPKAVLSTIATLLERYGDDYVAVELTVVLVGCILQQQPECAALLPECGVAAPCLTGVNHPVGAIAHQCSAISLALMGAPDSAAAVVKFGGVPRLTEAITLGHPDQLLPTLWALSEGAANPDVRETIVACGTLDAVNRVVIQRRSKLPIEFVFAGATLFANASLAESAKPVMAQQGFAAWLDLIEHGEGEITRMAASCIANCALDDVCKKKLHELNAGKILGTKINSKTEEDPRVVEILVLAQTNVGVSTARSSTGKGKPKKMAPVARPPTAPRTARDSPSVNRLVRPKKKTDAGVPRPPAKPWS